MAEKTRMTKMTRMTGFTGISQYRMTGIAK